MSVYITATDAAMEVKSAKKYISRAFHLFPKSSITSWFLHSSQNLLDHGFGDVQHTTDRSDNLCYWYVLWIDRDPNPHSNPYDPGGPGAGKGTQCTRLARDLDVVHVSVGDLLRAEQHQPLSARAEAIREHYYEGKHLDDTIYVDVLRERLALEIQNGRTNFIVDGFPRNICQTGYFERRVVRRRK
jgi:hypothetical protein